MSVVSLDHQSNELLSAGDLLQAQGREHIDQVRDIHIRAVRFLWNVVDSVEELHPDKIDDYLYAVQTAALSMDPDRFTLDRASQKLLLNRVQQSRSYMIDLKVLGIEGADGHRTLLGDFSDLA